MYSNYRKTYIPRIAVLFLTILLTTSLSADNKTRWGKYDKNDLLGYWQQVDVVVLDTAIDTSAEANQKWFYAPQFFRFDYSGTFKQHIRENWQNDKSPAMTGADKGAIDSIPGNKKIIWDERKQQFWLKIYNSQDLRLDIKLYNTTQDYGPLGTKIQPQAGDMTLTFYAEDDPMKAQYVRLLRRTENQSRNN